MAELLSREEKQPTEPTIDSMRNLLRRLEWSGIRMGQGSGFMDSGPGPLEKGYCPVCWGCDPNSRTARGLIPSAHGHRELCDMAWQLR